MLPLFFKDFIMYLLLMLLIFIKGLTVSPRLISSSWT